MSFDEETCLYVLREIGEQIVPFYPFSFGIDEVFILLLEYYGAESIADALGVLHELMEAEDNANGLGDDGDIWRSWRHSWRHRNDDPGNPFLPRVQGIVLPSPTLKMRRRTGAMSFSKEENLTPLEPSSELYSQADCSPASIPHNLNSSSHLSSSHIASSSVDSEHVFQDNRRALLPKTVSFRDYGDNFRTHGKERLMNENVAGRKSLVISEQEDIDSQQDFDEVRAFAESLDFDDAQLLSFEMLTPSDRRGGANEIRTFRPIQKTHSCVDSPLAARHKTGLSQRPSCQDSNLTSEPASKLKQDHFAQAGTTVASNDDTYLSSDASALDVLQNRVFRDGTTPCCNNYRDRYKDKFIKAVSPEGNAESYDLHMPQRMITHRNARMIDGAIFTGKDRELRNSVTVPRTITEKVDGKACNSVTRTTLASMRQKEPLRHSFIASIRVIFRKDQQQQQHDQTQNIEHKRTSSLLHDALNRAYDMVSPNRIIISAPSEPSSTTRVSNHTWGFDGVYDEDFGLRGSSLNLNKALPASPGNPGFRKTSSSHTATPSLDRSADTLIRPSTASSVSSGVSIKSSRREFRGLTRALISDDMSTRCPDLSPVREAETLPASTYDPQKSLPSSIYSEHLYEDSVNNNPFTEAPAPLTPGVHLPLSLSRTEDLTTFSEVPRISPSLPLRNVQRSARTQAGSRQDTLFLPAPPPACFQQDEVEGKAGPMARGRTHHRPATPTQPYRSSSADIAKNQKRSRSPMKKILGFGKSTSLKNIASEPRSQSKSASPEKSKTTPFRTLGNRMLHGFLTSDLDSTSDPNENTYSLRKVTPPTTLQSSFPISLDPPYQAKILSELELMICVTANKFLMYEYKAGRLSEDSISKIKYQWTARNRPQVLEFSYDQATQREFVVHNLKTVHFHGECGISGQVLHATLHNWKMLASEMAVRTFCAADSAIRKHMHDSHKVIEMLGATPATVTALADLQIKSLARINQKQIERRERSRHQETPSKQPTRGRRVGTPAPMVGHTPKSSKGSIDLQPSPGFEHAYDAFENSRGGRLGKMVRNMQEYH